MTISQKRSKQIIYKYIHGLGLHLSEKRSFDVTIAYWEKVFVSLTADCVKLTPNEDRVVLLSSPSSLDIESSDLTSTVSSFILKLLVPMIFYCFF